MTESTFSSLQWNLMKIVSWAALFNSFVIFEETIVDRSAWKKFIPGYRPGEPCVWDLTAAVVIAVVVYLVFRTRGRAA
ncbi:MAG: hypothetical protein HKN33_10720 [Pyrinomonadaceae bacterium]|nr:hypothetical protein [Pyrinomonadaceae bacterium]